MKLTRRETVLLWILIVAIAGLAYYYLFWIGWSAAEAELKDGITRLETEIMTEQSRLLLLPRIRDEVAELTGRSEDITRGVGTLPVRDEIPSLLSRVMPADAKYSLAMTLTDGEYTMTLTASVTASGPAGTLERLLGNLEADGARLAVRSVDMSAAAGGETIFLKLDFPYLK